MYLKAWMSTQPDCCTLVFGTLFLTRKAAQITSKSHSECLHNEHLFQYIKRDTKLSDWHVAGTLSVS